MIKRLPRRSTTIRDSYRSPRSLRKLRPLFTALPRRAIAVSLSILLSGGKWERVDQSTQRTDEDLQPRLRRTAAHRRLSCDHIGDKVHFQDFSSPLSQLLSYNGLPLALRS